MRPWVRVRSRPRLLIPRRPATAAGSRSAPRASACRVRGHRPRHGKRQYLRETVQGTDKAAHKRAEKALTKLLNQVNEQNSTPSAVALSYALDEWMRTSELEDR